MTTAELLSSAVRDDPGDGLATLALADAICDQDGTCPSLTLTRIAAAQMAKAIAIVGGDDARAVRVRMRLRNLTTVGSARRVPIVITSGNEPPHAVGGRGYYAVSAGALAAATKAPLATGARCVYVVSSVQVEVGAIWILARRDELEAK